MVQLTNRTGNYSENQKAKNNIKYSNWKIGIPVIYSSKIGNRALTTLSNKGTPLKHSKSAKYSPTL